MTHGNQHVTLGDFSRISNLNRIVENLIAECVNEAGLKAQRKIGGEYHLSPTLDPRYKWCEDGKPSWVKQQVNEGLE